MERERRLANLVWHCRLLPAALFLFAGLSKLIAPHRFAQVLALHWAIPEQVTPLGSYTLATVEVLLGAYMIIGVGRTVILRLGQALLIVFTTALSVKLTRGEVIPCGCFGTNDLISWHMVARNVGLVLILETSLRASRVLLPANPRQQRRRLLCLASTTGAILVSPIIAPVLGASLVMQPALVSSGPAIYGYGPLPGMPVC